LVKSNPDLSNYVLAKASDFLSPLPKQPIEPEQRTVNQDSNAPSVENSRNFPSVVEKSISSPELVTPNVKTTAKNTGRSPSSSRRVHTTVARDRSRSVKTPGSSKKSGHKKGNQKISESGSRTEQTSQNHVLDRTKSGPSPRTKEPKSVPPHRQEHVLDRTKSVPSPHIKEPKKADVVDDRTVLTQSDNISNRLSQQHKVMSMPNLIPKEEMQDGKDKDEDKQTRTPSPPQRRGSENIDREEAQKPGKKKLREKKIKEK